MSSRILVPVDGSEESRLAFTHAVAQFPESHIVLLHVIEPFADHTEAGGHDGRRSAAVFEERQHLVDEIAQLGEGYSGSITTELVYGRPVHVLPRYVDTHGVEEVVIGSRGRDGTARLLLGSVAETVVRRVPVPVTVVRSTGDDDGYHRPERILVPFDRSFCSRNALDYAFERFPAASVTALYVNYPLFETDHRPEPGDDSHEFAEADDAERDADTVIEMARRIADRNDRAIETAIADGDPSRGILNWIAEHDIDHVVIGCHGRDGVARWLLGSVAETVVRRAAVPVTAVK